MPKLKLGLLIIGLALTNSSWFVSSSFAKTKKIIYSGETNVDGKVLQSTIIWDFDPQQDRLQNEASIHSNSHRVSLGPDPSDPDAPFSHFECDHHWSIPQGTVHWLLSLDGELILKREIPVRWTTYWKSEKPVFRDEACHRPVFYSTRPLKGALSASSGDLNFSFESSLPNRSFGVFLNLSSIGSQANIEMRNGTFQGGRVLYETLNGARKALIGLTTYSPTLVESNELILYRTKKKK